MQRWSERRVPLPAPEPEARLRRRQLERQRAQLHLHGLSAEESAPYLKLPAGKELSGESNKLELVAAVPFPPRRAARLRGWPLSAAALTQHFPDISDRENAEKAPEARTYLKLGACVLVELRHFTDWHLRFSGQELDGSLVMGCCAVISVHGNGSIRCRATKASKRGQPACSLRCPWR